jgi:hypothetical protein
MAHYGWRPPVGSFEIQREWRQGSYWETWWHMWVYSAATTSVGDCKRQCEIVGMCVFKMGRPQLHAGCMLGSSWLAQNFHHTQAGPKQF